MHTNGSGALFQFEGVTKTYGSVTALDGAESGLGATALPAGLRDGSMKWKAIGAVLLTLAICSHHFTAMGAVSIIPDPTVLVSALALPAGWLALGVALASLTILFLACAGLALDMKPALLVQVAFQLAWTND